VLSYTHEGTVHDALRHNGVSGITELPEEEGREKKAADAVHGDKRGWTCKHAAMERGFHINLRFL
jgi:hypothetical protein